jgi:hypothetical protein
MHIILQKSPQKTKNGDYQSHAEFKFFFVVVVGFKVKNLPLNTISQYGTVLGNRQISILGGFRFKAFLED